MTAFLRLNGITVPVATGSASAPAPTDIGAEDRAEDGTLMFTRRATKFSWSGKTVLSTAGAAHAWRDLVLGRGSVINWDANNHYSYAGLAPSVVNIDFTITATNPKFGGFRAASAATATNRAQWVMFTATSPWTCCMWDTTDGGATWHHYVVNSIGQKWVDGVRNDGATTTFFNVSSGLMTLGINGAAHGFDDFVGFPQLMPTDWPPQVYAFGQAFAPLPQLKADGLWIEQNSVITVKGKAGDMTPILTKSGPRFGFSFTLLQA